MSYSYEIGTTFVGMVNISTLGIVAPKSSFKPFSSSVILGNGQKKGLGFPEARWHWDYLNPDQREALKNFVTDLSSTVFIATRTNEDANDDGQDDYADFQAIMRWVDEEEKDNQKRFDVDIIFTHLVAQ